MIKYMISKKKSSAAFTWKVNRGGIKKKFQINTLNTAAMITGKILNNKDKNDSVISNTKETTL